MTFEIECTRCHAFFVIPDEDVFGLEYDTHCPHCNQQIYGFFVLTEGEVQE